MSLDDFIYKNFRNNKAAFAKSQSVTPQQVTKWINAGWTVNKDNWLMQPPKRKLKTS